MKHELATFTDRIIAYIIDRLILSIILMPILLLLFGDQTANFKKAMETGEVDGQFMAYYMFQLISTAAIIIFCWIKFAASPGKRAMKIKILNEQYQPASNTQYIVRYCSYFLSVLSFGLGFAWMIFDDKNQTFHDKVARTIVVKENTSSSANQEKNQSFENKNSKSKSDDDFLA